MAYLIQNTRTDDFIDNDGEWTVIRSFAKRFPSKLDAERYIDQHQTRNDDPYMKVVKESTHRSFKKFVEAKKLTEDKRYDDEIVRKAFMTALGGKNWNNFIQAGYDGKLHTWNEINNFLVKAGASFNDCAKVSNKLEDLEDDYHYADCVYEGCKKLTEGVMTFKVSPTKNSYGDTVYFVSQIKLDDGSVWNNYPRLLFGPDNKYEEKSSVKRAIDRYMEGRGEYKIIGI